MKNVIIILILFCVSTTLYSQEIQPVAAGDEVIMVKDTTAILLTNKYSAGENRVFLLLENGEFRIYDEKTKKIFTATNLNRDIKEVNYIHLLLDEKMIKIKGK